MKKEATELLTEALKRRGLFVEVIIFKEGNTKVDVQKTQKLLNHIGIPAFWQLLFMLTAVLVRCSILQGQAR